MKYTNVVGNVDWGRFRQLVLNVKTGFVAGILLFSICFSCTTDRKPTDQLEKPAGYLFATFEGEFTPLGEQIYFGISKDGRNWSALNEARPILISQLGEKGVRDSYILRSYDGKSFFLIATDLCVYNNNDWKRAVQKGSRSIVIWESTDLVNWSEPRLVKVAPDDAGSTWAPEAIYDQESGDYLVFWASVTERDQFEKRRIWAARTKDFYSFSEPFIYIDKPTTILDATIIKDGDYYYRFIKDVKYSAITMEKSKDINGTWEEVPGFNLARLKGYEGPTAYMIKPATKEHSAVWALAIDNYARKGGYHVWLTDDLASGVFKKDHNVSFPFNFRHGSVLPLSKEEYERLKANR